MLNTVAQPQQTRRICQASRPESTMHTPSPDHAFCTHDQLLQRCERIDPRAYDKTRNYLDGAVTWLSPFTTHGVLSTKQIADIVLSSHRAKSCYRLLFELGWREFFHRTWQLNGDDIFTDMKQPQAKVLSDDLPTAIESSSTQINVIDQCLDELKEKGFMHNHARMWVAAMACNMAFTHWQEPARWLHYHLLDGDLASNTLSWQWVAGTFSHKQYVANQSNIDKYSKSQQPDSWLDVPYEAFDNFVSPQHMLERGSASYEHALPGTPIPKLTGKVALRNIWHLDPTWQTDMAQQIVFIDSDVAAAWPMSPRRWQFIEYWANQCNAIIHYGTVAQLQAACAEASVVRTEYPMCQDWPGTVQERLWLYPMPDKSFNSFSQYFKQVKHHAGL